MSKKKWTTTAAVATALVLFWSATAAEHVKYKDPSQPLNVRIKDLLGRMTVEEKVAQMAQIERSIATPELMKKYSFGTFYH